MSVLTCDTSAQRRHAAVDLLTASAQMLEEAAASPSPAQRYSRAYVSALRTAAAAVAVTAQRRSVDSRPRSVWMLLVRRVPELAEWGEYFAAVSGRRVAAEAGVPGAVNQRQADDLVRDAATFLVQTIEMLERTSDLRLPRPIPAADRLR